MSNKSYRIRTTAGGNDKYLTVKLENEVDFFEILSLKISQKDIYGTFNSDYGVVVGRVLANGGVGIPNTKISIFIPISDEDKLRADISSIYPYTSPRDKDLDGVRYNLLPRVAVNNPFLVAGDYSPKVPVGTFPTKEEITTNDSFLEVYEKYYKYTTVTNQSGDYMIFGVPIGIQTVHMSIDITDIGKYSMNPATMITNLGYSPNLFTDNGTKVKFSTDLETLPNVETQEVAVEVRPFWGDSENFEIGITRQDFKVRALLTTSFTLFGSAFTDGGRGTWGENSILSGDQGEEFWRINDEGNTNIGIASRRIGSIDSKFHYMKNTVSDTDIDGGNFSTTDDVVELTDSEYTTYVDAGQFVYVITCNRKKIITNEFGEDVEVDADNTNGVFTEFRGMMYATYAEDELDPPDFGSISGGKFESHTFFSQRWRMKIPQYHPEDIASGSIYNSANFNPSTAKYALTASDLKSHNKYNSSTPAKEVYNETWRKFNHTFSASKLYSIAKYHPLSYNTGGGYVYDNITAGLDAFWNTGILVTSGGGDLDDTNPELQFPSNSTQFGAAFGAEWINFCLYFPQHTFFYRNNSNDNEPHSNDNPVDLDSSRGGNYFMYFVNNNNNLLIGKTIGTARYLRNDWHKTMFIEVPKEDIINIRDRTLDLTSQKGFRSNQAPYTTNPLIGTEYKGKTSVKYFYKGLYDADCIIYLNSLGFI